MTKKKEIVVCSVCDDGCKAPAGWATATGMIENTTACARATCAECDNPVCTNCSKVRRVAGKKRRLCNACEVRLCEAARQKELWTRKK